MIGKRLSREDGIAGLLDEINDHFVGRTTVYDIYLREESSSLLSAYISTRSTKQRRHAWGGPVADHYLPFLISDCDGHSSHGPGANERVPIAASNSNGLLWQGPRVSDPITPEPAPTSVRRPSSAFSGEVADCDAAVRAGVSGEMKKALVPSESASSGMAGGLQRLLSRLFRPLLYLVYMPGSDVHTTRFVSGGRIKVMKQKTIAELWQWPNLVRTFLRNAIIHIGLRFDELKEAAQSIELEDPLVAWDYTLRLAARATCSGLRELSEITARRALERTLECLVAAQLLEPTTWVKLTKTVSESAYRKINQKGFSRLGCAAAMAKTGAWAHLLNPASSFLVTVASQTAACLAVETHHVLQACRRRHRCCGRNTGTSAGYDSGATTTSGRGGGGGQGKGRGGRAQGSNAHVACGDRNNDNEGEECDECPVESRARWGDLRPLLLMSEVLAFPQVPVECADDSGARRRFLASAWVKSVRGAAAQQTTLYVVLVVLTPVGTLLWPGKGTQAAVMAAQHMLPYVHVGLRYVLNWWSGDYQVD
eukprot:jgi/Mesvir1/17481/Mv08754-RA.1